MKFTKKKVIEEVVRIHGVDLCRIDMLVRLDEYDGKFLDCGNCIFKDISGVIRVCPYKWVDNHGSVVH